MIMQACLHYTIVSYDPELQRTLRKSVNKENR